MTTLAPHRIAVLDHTAVTSGAEIALARWVAHLDPTRFVPVVVLFGDGPLVELLEELGVETYVFPIDERIAHTDRASLLNLRTARHALSTATYALKLARRLRELDVALVHTNSLKSDIIGTAAAKLLRKPVVWHLHDRIADDYMPNTIARVFRFLTRRVPSHVVVNSRATLETVQPLPRGCTLAYPGLPDDLRETPPPEADRSEARTIGIIGRLSPTKGQELFLRACAEVAQTHRDVAFRVVGSAMFNESSYEHRIHLLCDQLRITDKVKFTGFVNDTAREMRAMTAVVHASPVPEPFGQVIAEAMALHVPIIATNAGGVTEVMIDGPEPLGQLVTPGDVAEMAHAMRWVLDNPAEAARRAARAHESVWRRFGIERTVEAIMGAWDRVLLQRR